MHRYFCKPGIVDEHIPDDDGDPDWIDEDECITEVPYTRLPDRRVIAAWPDSEIFIDVPHPSPYRKGLVFRVRTSTFSPDFLRSYRALWEAPDCRRRQIEKVCRNFTSTFRVRFSPDCRSRRNRRLDRPGLAGPGSTNRRG